VDGRRQELVDDVVLRAVLRLLRERIGAELVIVDSTYHPDGPDANCDIHFLPLLEEFGVPYIETSRQEMAWYTVPGGGRMFEGYHLNRCFLDVDEVISVATLKSHAFMGITLCTKNLFGLCPVHPQNRPRGYFHHLVRMPYFLGDLGRVLDPCLNIIDGLVGQSHREWNGEARVANTLVAGDNCIATDTCAASLMGHDPLSDWPTPPFRRDRNYLRLAADAGFGSVNRLDIDFQHNLQAPVASFDSDATDPPAIVASWRRTTCEQALYFRDHHRFFLDNYAGEYIYLQDGQVLWHAPSRPPHISRREMAGARKDRALWLKYVDPEETEGEHFEVYEKELRRMDEMGFAAADSQTATPDAGQLVTAGAR
jgi:hypothetical protein